MRAALSDWVSGFSGVEMNCRREILWASGIGSGSGGRAGTLGRRAVVGREEVRYCAVFMLRDGELM